MNQSKDQSRADSRRRTRRIAVGMGCMLILLLFAVSQYQADKPTNPAQNINLQQRGSVFPPGVELDASDKQIVGDLGGLQVNLPPEFVRNVEYDNDPGLGEIGNGPAPERTYASGIRSLGFTVRYPDFSVTTKKERQRDRQRYSIFNTPWMEVGITASSFFGDGLFLERSFLNRNIDPLFQYEKLPDKIFGMTAYTPINVDKNLRFLDPVSGTYKSDARDRDLFFSYLESGKIDSYIECSNRQHTAATCMHFFFVDPNLRIKVTAIYRREQLKNWNQIQSSIRSLILSFKAK